MSDGVAGHEVFKAATASTIVAPPSISPWSLRLIAIVLVFVGLCESLAVQTHHPRVFLINAQKLSETKQRIQTADKTFAAALPKLEIDARTALQQEPTAVRIKGVTP